MSPSDPQPWQRTDRDASEPFPGTGTSTTGPGAPGSDVVVGSVTGIRVVDDLIDRAVGIPSSVIHAHVDRLRRRNPHATPAQIIALLERQYLLAVSTSGGAVGAAAAMPVVGTGVSVALTTTEVGTFFAASAAFSLAVADVHGIGVEETARRRALLMATILGEQGSATVGAEAGINPRAWAKTLLVNMPTQTIKRVNNALTRRLIRRQAGKQGALALGRLAPFGVGAVVGATGARAMGRTVVQGAHKAFGPPPASFPREIELAVSGPDESRAPLRLVEPGRAAIGATPQDAPQDRPQDAGASADAGAGTAAGTGAGAGTPGSRRRWRRRG